MRMWQSATDRVRYGERAAQRRRQGAHCQELFEVNGMAREVIVKIRLDGKDAERAAEATGRKIKSALDANTLGITTARGAVLGLTSALTALGTAAVFKQ